MTKTAARTRLKARLSALTPPARRQAADQVAAAVRNSPVWQESSTLLAYLAFAPEMNADPLISAALKEGKTTAVPRVEGKELRFYHLRSWNQRLPLSPRGIREPAPRALPWHPPRDPAPVLILVPGLGFTLQGKRLGRGGGHYDRLLPPLRAVLGASLQVWGLAWETQILEDLPRDPWDFPMDGLVTEKGIRLFLPPDTGRNPLGGVS